MAGTDNQGHMLHMAERSRRDGAYWFSGIAGNGTSDYLTISGSTVYVKTTAGVVFQMHRHAVSAKDTDPGGANDDIHVVNWNGDAYHDIHNLNDITADAQGNSLTNKWFNITLWGVANKTGEYSPLMLNLPNGSYTNKANAEGDVDGYDVLTMPREFNLESSTGFLIARITIRDTATWTYGSYVDLRGQTPATATGGASGTSTDFADNQFTIFDEVDTTKIMAFDAGTLITTGNTRTYQAPDSDGILFLDTGAVPMSGNLVLAGNHLSSSGAINLLASGDTDDYLQVSTAANVTSLSFIGNDGKLVWDAETFIQGFPNSASGSRHIHLKADRGHIIFDLHNSGVITFEDDNRGVLTTFTSPSNDRWVMGNSFAPDADGTRTMGVYDPGGEGIYRWSRLDMANHIHLGKGETNPSFRLASDTGKIWLGADETSDYDAYFDGTDGLLGVTNSKNTKLYSAQITSMGSAGFVENDASGNLTGGNTIAVADITDIATTYLQIDGSNANTTINIGSEDLTTTGTFTGINVTSGSDPGHTHTVSALTDIATTYLKLDASNDPMTGDLTFVGSQILSNTDFATSANWTFGGDWTHDAPNQWAELTTTQGDTGTLEPDDLSVTSGKVYKVTFGSSVFGATLDVSIGGVSYPQITSEGTVSTFVSHTFYAKATNTDNLEFLGEITAAAKTRCMVDNVTVYEIGNVDADITAQYLTLNTGTFAVNGETEFGSDDVGIKKLYLANDSVASSSELTEFRGLKCSLSGGDMFIGRDNIFPAYYAQRVVVTDSVVNDNSQDFTNLYQGNSTIFITHSNMG